MPRNPPVPPAPTSQSWPMRWAALAGAPDITSERIAEAIHYRSLEHSSWK